MFENFKKIAGFKEAETITTNNPEIADGVMELENTSPELFYESPEYKDVEEVYNQIGSDAFFEEIDGQVVPADDLYEDGLDDVVVPKNDGVIKVEEAAPAPSPEKEGVSDRPTPQGYVRLGNVLRPLWGAASILALAACDRTVEEGGSWSPHFKWGKDGKEHTVEIGSNFKLTNKQSHRTDANGNEIIVKTDANGNEIKNPENKPEHKDVPEHKDEKEHHHDVVAPEKEVKSVVHETAGGGMDSTLPNKEGPGKELFRKYKPFIVPSGDLEKGYISLCDETADAVAQGVLKPFPGINRFALAVTEKPEIQGVPYESIWILKLSEGKMPRPLTGKKASFKDYIAKDGGGVWRITDIEKYKRDLAAAVPQEPYTNAKGELNNTRYHQEVERVVRFGLLEINVVDEWQNANEAKRKEMVNRYVAPYENRTGTIK